MIGRAIEWATALCAKPQPELDDIAEQNERRHFVLAARALEDRVPRVFGVGEDDSTKALRCSFFGGLLVGLPGKLARSLSLPSAIGVQELARIDAEDQRQIRRSRPDPSPPTHAARAPPRETPAKSAAGGFAAAVFNIFALPAAIGLHGRSALLGLGCQFSAILARRNCLCRPDAHAARLNTLVCGIPIWRTEATSGVPSSWGRTDAIATWFRSWGPSVVTARWRSFS